MTVVKLPRVLLLSNHIMMKQVEQLVATDGLGFEPVAAKQWFRDIYAASEEATSLIRPLTDKAKELQEGEDKEAADAAANELSEKVTEQVVLNIIPLPIQAKGKNISIATYLVLEALNNMNIIKCDLFITKKAK